MRLRARPGERRDSVRAPVGGDGPLASNGHTTLIQAVGQYVSTLRRDKKGDKADADTLKELQRFVSWCRHDRAMADISPSVIGAYADSVAGTGTNPQAAERLQAVRKFLTFARKEDIIAINLAQHVRIRRARTRGAAGGVVQEEPRVQLTAEGHKQLTAELEGLKAQRAPLAIEIQKAAADKDVRENAPLEAAREELGRVESRIREIELTLDNAVVIDPSDPTRSQTVKLGTVVSVQDVSSGRKSSYTVVSASEANPLDLKISDVSPLGKELLGKAAGTEVYAHVSGRTMTYKILSIS